MKAAIQQAPTKLRRVQIREIMKRHKGCIQDLAAEIKVTPPMISLWLAGRTKSKAVEQACRKRAEELLEQESANAA